MSRPDPFLTRWSRLKQNPLAPASEAAPATQAVPPVVVAPASDQTRTENQDLTADSPAAAVPAVALPDPASLTLDSDFTAFLKSEVGDAVRRQALKKLFNDPHFNVMDGLDIYIGDYSVSEPIPPELLAKLRSASEWLAGREDAEAATGAVVEHVTEVAAPAAETVQAPGPEPAASPGASADEPDAGSSRALAPAAAHDPKRAPD